MNGIDDKLEDEQLLTGVEWKKVGGVFRRGVTTGEQQCYTKTGYKAFQFPCDDINNGYKDCVGGMDEGGYGNKFCSRRRLKIDASYKCIHHKAIVDGNKVEVCDWRHVGRIG